MLGGGGAGKQADASGGRAGQGAAALNGCADSVSRSAVAPADLRTSTEIFVEVLDPNWSVVYSTGVLDGAAPTIAPKLRSGAAHGAFDTEDGLRLYAMRVSNGFVIAGQSTRVPQSNLSGVVGFLVISGIPTLLAALAASC